MPLLCPGLVPRFCGWGSGAGWLCYRVASPGGLAWAPPWHGSLSNHSSVVANSPSTQPRGQASPDPALEVKQCRSHCVVGVTEKSWAAPDPKGRDFINVGALAGLVHKDYHRRLAGSRPLWRGLCFPTLPRCPGGRRDHPPDSRSQKLCPRPNSQASWASSSAHTGPGGAAGCGCVRVGTDHRACAAAVRTGGLSTRSTAFLEFEFGEVAFCDDAS